MPSTLQPASRTVTLPSISTLESMATNGNERELPRGFATVFACCVVMV